MTRSDRSRDAGGMTVQQARAERLLDAESA
jgi:hypothetical protein